MSADDDLITAARAGTISVIDILITNGYISNISIALRHAAYEGHLDVVKALICAGADVHVWEGATLRGSALNGHTEVVKVLLNAGADVNCLNGTALRHAAKNGHTETVKLLLANGAGKLAKLALRGASQKGCTEIVEILNKYI